MATAPYVPFSRRDYPLRPNEVAVPLQEYLSSSYEPDMDYVDGHVENRNMGDFDHSELQRALLVAIERSAREWKIRVLPECRLQINPDRFRVPDIMVISRGERPDRIVRQAPLLCIEVLSPDDTFRRIQARVDDYVAMGVKNVWVLDPADGRVFSVANGRQQFVEDRILTVEGTAIRVDLDEIKADLAD